MSERGSVVFGDSLIEYVVIRSRRRRKTVAITLDPRQGVLVSAPSTAASTRIHEIVARRAGWIVRQSTDGVLRSQRKMLVNGDSLPYLGRQVRLFIQTGAVRRADVAFDHWSFRVVAPRNLSGEARRSSIERASLRWYRERAADRLTRRVERWAEHLSDRAPTRVLIRAQRRRWGSCGPDGTLRLNWRIVMASPDLIDYVIVHELLHLRIRTHSVRFWTEMARAIPDYQDRRARLKEIGPLLTI